ncbi:MAG: phosphatase PAP2 family protein [Haliscomenobacter sp.]|uniref:phosphatase PAP2 family protein n=1 Tax=Haliscomenobacter sp. TaxID=2717303 RepID=UPI0029AFC595|nr:phosphatase PAP2 family protein [Haliscomenobacter sp.]MDX2067628.1 phosphatase PAP2 family protein [Haliscomenobacter sp.]
MEQLIAADQFLFELINGQSHNAVLDWLMPIWREKSTWIPLYIALAAFLGYKYRLQGLYLILALALAVGLADTVSSKIIKPSVHRLRPCNDPTLKDEVQLLVHCGSGYSFTSSHASNHFAVAAFLSLTLGLHYRRIRWPLYLWAASIALGQVYVGVHFPLDIIIGAILGIIIGNIVAKTYLRLFKNPFLQTQV